MKVSVVIGTVSAATVGHAVESIRQQTWQDWELFVVGQGSDKELPRFGADIEKADSRISYLHLETRGVCRARNAGIAASGAGIVAFTDDDCVADPRWLEVLVEYFEREPHIGVVGGSVVAPPARKRSLTRCPSVSPEESLYEPAEGRRQPAGWDWIGCNLAVKKHVFAECGGWDDYLGPGTEFPAGEDTDLKLRFEAGGVAMRCTPRAVVRHELGRRYGLRVVLRHSRNYAWGNGGLAGKLTLLGDRRGEEWLGTTRKEWLGSLRQGHVHLAPPKIARYRDYTRAYRRCLAAYAIERKTGNLTPKVHAS